MDGLMCLSPKAAMTLKAIVCMCPTREPYGVHNTPLHMYLQLHNKVLIIPHNTSRPTTFINDRVHGQKDMKHISSKRKKLAG